ncbi:NADPH-dependent F420 reductase [Sphingosinicella terrae]|uniref:NADPH-dependent F420 reductase n=1 Tax=Sphingosinicella terrae TaxID=2172047 RepID=UPI000E0D7C1B|nr:NADPH-dependent F420 reductase [Sphingosinicella terrae]
MVEPGRPVLAVLGGTGKEGRGLALRWAHAGYPVVVGSRSPERAREAAAGLNDRLGRTAVVGTGNEEAARQGEIVILAVPYSVQLPTAEEVAPALPGKILIDVTVPLVPPAVSRVQLPSAGSAVLALQARLGSGVRVVSAFQNISAEHLQSLDHPIDCDVLVCGDDPAAAETVVAMAAEIGMRAFHAGPLANSAATEAMTSVLIALNRRYKARSAGIRITGIA